MGGLADACISLSQGERMVTNLRGSRHRNQHPHAHKSHVLPFSVLILLFLHSIFKLFTKGNDTWKLQEICRERTERK